MLRPLFKEGIEAALKRGIGNKGIREMSSRIPVPNKEVAREVALQSRLSKIGPNAGKLTGSNKFEIDGKPMLAKVADAKTNRIKVQPDDPKTGTKARADSTRKVREAKGSKENLKQMKARARELSQDPMHKKLFGKEKSIAEHNLALQKGGTNDDMYVSDPMFRKFKDAVERKLYQSKKYKGYMVLNDPDTPGGLRIIREKDYVEGGDARDMRGITIDDMEQLQEALEALSKYK